MASPEYDEEEIINLLASTPCTKEVAQNYLQRGHGVRLPRTSWDLMWERLSERLGEERAVDAVCELVLATANARVAELIAEYQQDGEVALRSTEPKMAELLFDDDGDPTDLGGIVLEYMVRKEARPRRSPSRPSRPNAHRATPGLARVSHPSEIPIHVQLRDVDDAREGPKSAASGTGWRLERVRASKGTFLAAQPGWTETQLEDFIVANWSNVDFGLDKRLRLVARQVRLKATREKVDLLATDDDNTFVAIELKIKPASGNDLTQLLSYMQDLAFSGRRPDQIRGVLVAPDFGEKVLNAATLDPRVVLLRFLSER